MTIESDIQKLDPGAIVTLFELDATALGGTVDRFFAGVNEQGSSVVWQGNTYTPWPIDADGFERKASGTLPRPVIQVGNKGGLISALIKGYRHLVGAKLTRKRTFVRYLDAVNFSGGNPSADPNTHFPDEIWFIARKPHDNKTYVEFELSAAIDVADVNLPRRQVIQNVCTWIYKSAECGYAGGAVADINDQPTSDPQLDQCGKRLASCRLRFGQYGESPFGGFPGVGLLR